MYWGIGALCGCGCGLGWGNWVNAMEVDEVTGGCGQWVVVGAVGGSGMKGMGLSVEGGC